MNKRDNKIKNITVKIDTTYKYVQLITEDENFCSVKNKKEAARIVGIKDYNTLNNYVKKFKDKGAVILSHNTYKLNPFLNPDTDCVEIKINRE